MRVLSDRVWRDIEGDDLENRNKLLLRNMQFGISVISIVYLIILSYIEPIHMREHNGYILTIFYFCMIIFAFYLLKKNYYKLSLYLTLGCFNVFLVYQIHLNSIELAEFGVFLLLISLFISLIFVPEIIAISIICIDIFGYYISIYDEPYVNEVLEALHLPITLLFALSLLFFVKINNRTILNQVDQKNELTAYLLSIFENSPYGIAVFDTMGKVIDCNHKYVQIIEYSFEEIIGNPFMKYTHPDDRSGNIEIFRKLVKMELSSVRLEKRYITKSGNIIFVEITGAPIIGNNSKVNHIIGMVSDITKFRNHERVENALRDEQWHAQKQESIGRLSSGVAHDVNNSLAIINGYIDILLSTNTHLINNSELLSEIKRAVGRASSTTKQLLKYGRSRVGEVEMVNINELVTELESFAKIVIFDDNIKFEVRESPDGRFVNIIKDQVSQVLINLILNAREAIEEKGIISLYVQERVNNLEIHVKDNGVGISKKNQRFIFDPYFTTKSTGTGLGLYTSFNVVKQNGGLLSFHSEEGLGTDFVLTFPLVEEDQYIDGITEVLNYEIESKHIMIVDDEKQIGLILKKILSKDGHETSVFHDPKLALLYYKENFTEIDLVLSDIKMPFMTGFEMAKKILEFDPTQKIVFITGFGEEILKFEDKIFETIPLIHKPFDIQTIKKMLNKIFLKISIQN